MHTDNDNALFDRAAEIIRQNDRSHYTVPTQGLYPFQWNWDSCLTAIGMMKLDEDRAWTEIETLFDNQWSDGMVPHIIFHIDDEGYFPGPSVWNTGRSVPTSGITQPPVAGFAIRRMVEFAKDRTQALGRARKLIAAIDCWHRWFFANRDPYGEGLIAIIHPWESGRDNSIDWDVAFDRVPTEGIAPYVRRDLQHADADHRPTKAQYDRYIWLIECFKRLKWDNAKLHDGSPFKMVDPGFNAILIRSCIDLAALADELGENAIATANRRRAARGGAALERLWSDAHGQYLCLDRCTGELVQSASVGGILPIFAGIPKDRAATLVERIKTLGKVARYPVPSHDPTDPRYDGKRYWRGPSWLIINYMICEGLIRIGDIDMAAMLRQRCLDLCRQSDFAEYYDPISGEPCGGGQFTWTAAIAIAFLNRFKGNS